MPRLTEQEQQEIVRFIEADRPLPEKYRFLLFEDKREVELVWNGKTSEVCNIVLPFQVIEQVDEPRAEKPDTRLQLDLFTLDARGRQLKGWTNKLIWGDNKLILSSLKNGPLREEIEKQGGIKLIYIDPPFDVGADFSMDIEIGGDTFTKKPNILEEIAYRDTWGTRADLFEIGPWIKNQRGLSDVAAIVVKPHVKEQRGGRADGFLGFLFAGFDCQRGGGAQEQGSSIVVEKGQIWGWARTRRGSSPARS